MRAVAAALLVTTLLVLHQDAWFWHDVRPLVLGALPIGLFYHAAYTVATSVVLVALERLLWPSHLDAEERSGQ